MDHSEEETREPAQVIFKEALKLSSQERDAYLSRACQGDQDLRDNVEEMLSLYFQDTGNLQKFFQVPLSDKETGSLRGRRIGAYLLREELGRGGMGVVYRAVRDDGELRMTVAIKLIKHNRTAPEFLARFRKERQLLADLRHAHIAQLLDVGTTPEGLPYLIMEYVDGTSITRWCNAKNLDLLGCLRLFRKLLEAVAVAHRKGVIHRDIKPANVIVTNEGEPVLLDFGIAHTVNPNEETGLTEPGMVLMTPAYAAPEQRLGVPATPRFDIYALGLLLLEVITGQRPLAGDKDPMSKLEKLALNKEMEGADSLQFPPLHKILSNALAQDPERRYATCEDVLADLDHLIVYMADPQVKGLSMGIMPHWDVVVLTTHEDLPKAQELFRGLEELGLNIYLLTVAAGHEKIVQVLMRTGTCIPCLGPEAVPPWKYEQIGDTLAHCIRSNQLELMPLLLPGSRRPDKESRLPFYLRRQVWLGFPQDKDQYTNLKNQILKRGQTSTGTTATQTCPFRGLEVFREEDASFFFGREEMTQRMEEYLRVHNFLAVLGPSGSGKSSVVRAGLLPRLREKGITPVVLTPGARPLEELAIKLRNLTEGDIDSSEQLYRRLCQDERALHFILREHYLSESHGRVCLVVDQFEEVFTVGEVHDKTVLFLKNILYAVERMNEYLMVVLTLRSDFIGKCVLWPELNHYVCEHMIQMEPMDERALTDAVIKPARQVGLIFEPNLANVIIDDVMGAAGELPLLEHALLELYKRRNGKWLTAAAYAEIGGITGALAQRAETEYLALGDHQRQTLRKMFTLCLVHPGEGSEDTRRRATREELNGMSDQAGRVDELLSHWTDCRLLTAFYDENRKVDYFDVAHEALIRKWDRIKTWMNEDRETARLIRQLRARAKSWDDSGRHDDFLMRGGQLFQMTELRGREDQHLGDREMAFIEAGLVLEERDKRDFLRRRNLTVASLLSALLLALAFSLTLFFSGKEEKALRLEAEKASEEAREAAALAEKARQSANYNLALASDASVGVALDQGKPVDAWLGTLHALSQDIPAGRDLPLSQGRFLDPRIGELERQLWVSPIVPRINQFASDRSGRRLALAGRDGLVRVMEIKTGRQQKVLSGANHQITDLAFSPDNRYLGGASLKQEVYLWDLEEGFFQVFNTGFRGVVNTIAFSPDGDWMVAGGEDGRLVLQPLTDKEPIHHQLNGKIRDLAFGPSGLLYTASDAGLVTLSPPEYIPTQLPLPLEATPTTLCWSKDGLVSGWSNGQVIFHKDSELVIGGNGHPNAVTNLVSDQSGYRLLSGGGGLTFGWELSGSIPEFTVMDDLPAFINVGFNTAEGFFCVEDSGRFLSVKDDDIKNALLGHDEFVVSVSISPDGRWLASGAADGTIGIWHMANREPAHFFRGHSDRVWDLAFSPDSSSLASASADHKIKIWDLQGTPLSLLEGHTGPVKAVAFSADGRRLASASSDQSIRTWNLSRGSLVSVLLGHTGEVQGVSFSKDNQWLASASSDQTVRLWTVSTGRAGPVLKGHSGGVESVEFSPDSKWLASSSGDRTIRMWDMKTKKLGEVLVGHTSRVNSVVFSPDGTKLASASLDNTTRIWDLRGDGEPLVLKGYGSSVYDVSFSPDNSTLATANYDHTVRLWNVGHLTSRHVLRGHSDYVFGTAFSPDGSKLASASFDGTLRLWPTNTGLPGPILNGHRFRIFGLAFSPDGKWLASASDDHTVRLWSGSDGRPGPVLKGHKDGAYGVSFSPDGKWLASASKDRTVRLWTVPDGSPGPILSGHLDEVLVVAFSPDGAWLASSSRDHTIRIWSTADWRSGSMLKGHSDTVNGVAFSTDSSLLATASRDNTVRLWSTNDWSMEAVLRGHSDTVQGVVFSPDGRWLASTDVDHMVRIWDVKERRTVAILQGHEDEVNWFPSISPEGLLLATPSDDKTVRLWRLDRLLLPSADQNPRDFYRGLMDRSLYTLGYRQEGLHFVSQPRMQMYPQGKERDPFHHLDYPRPSKTPLGQWLSQGSVTGSQ